MKSLNVFTALSLAISSTVLAAETPSTQDTPQKTAHSLEFLMKLSQPDTSRTAFGLSYGSNLRGFFYLDLQDVPATLERQERQVHVPAYALGFTIRDNKIGGENTNPMSATLRMSTDVFLRYSEESDLINRDGFWTLGVQPGLNLSGLGGVSVNLGIEYNVNLIAHKDAVKQTQMRAAGVTKTSLTPVLTFNFQR